MSQADAEEAFVAQQQRPQDNSTLVVLLKFFCDPYM
jgi:hypothetical protein